MKISRRAKRFHDPYGHRTAGGITQVQWLVGNADAAINGRCIYVDMISAMESNYSVIRTNYSVEKLRK